MIAPENRATVGEGHMTATTGIETAVSGSLTSEQAAWFASTFATMADNIGVAVLGKDHVVRLALTCLRSEGHLLLEDLPGTGKTMLARALSNTIEGTHARIQFTPDLLPTDVPASRSTTSTRAPSTSTRARSSTTSCSPTRSTAPRPRRRPRCSR